MNGKEDTLRRMCNVHIKKDTAILKIISRKFRDVIIAFFNLIYDCASKQMRLQILLRVPPSRDRGYSTNDFRIITQKISCNIQTGDREKPFQDVLRIKIFANELTLPFLYYFFSDLVSDPLHNIRTTYNQENSFVLQKKISKKEILHKCHSISRHVIIFIMFNCFGTYRALCGFVDFGNTLY